MQLVDNDTFFKQLAALFETSKDTGSIWLTHKRLTYDGGDAQMLPADPSDDTNEYPCLVRVTDGKEANFSTRVEPGQLDAFHVQYGTLLKGSMSTMRKRDKKREQQRKEEAARRKRRLAEDVVVEGSKRGNGRRKRQRKIKSALKQEETRKRVKEREETRSKAKA
ncbi:signal recognition particle, SRP9/SRP14 subunit [Phanerochaete sordida]|uniref:Signal recognition particle subunit SRP14 n=1 Tax=Phanerochaete sordida TaxID=48140 RepID=A0A9P3LL16_9APHY|nr:signal recognition particle, SRP9/SRP14 subunit [Phanerochaete sordida]